MTPFNVVLKTSAGDPVRCASVPGIGILLSKVDVFDENERRIDGAFPVPDAGEVVCTLKGEWTGWNFRFKHGEEDVALVSKQNGPATAGIIYDSQQLDARNGGQRFTERPVRLLIKGAVILKAQLEIWSAGTL